MLISVRRNKVDLQADIARQFGAEVRPDDNASLDESWGEWPAFPDSVEALKYLRQHFRLVAVTNAGESASSQHQRHLVDHMSAAHTHRACG